MTHSQRVAALAAFVVAAAGGLATLSSPANALGVSSTDVTITVPGIGLDLTSTVDETGDVQDVSVGVDDTDEATVSGVEDGQADDVDLGDVDDVNDGQVGDNEGQDGNHDDATAGDSNDDATAGDSNDDATADDSSDDATADDSASDGSDG